MIDILVTTKDRHSELSLLIQSLLNQTYKDWDLYILEDGSGTPMFNCYFLQKIIQDAKLKGHKVMQIRNEISVGNCKAREQLRQVQKEKGIGEFVCRLDDDVILEKSYLQKMLDVIHSGFDLASGVTPSFGMPEFIREVKYVKPIINYHEFDKEGNLIKFNDDCGMEYDEGIILPTHQFRSCALMKAEVSHEIAYEDNLSFVAFREEGFYSFRAILAGYKLGVHTGAKAYHLQCPSGGTRLQNYMQCVQLDDETFKKFAKKQYKKRGDFLK